MILVLFDDAVADGWHPFALTRPVGELRFGRWLLRERLETWAGVPARRVLTRPWLAAYAEADAPPAAAREAGVPSAGDDDLLLLSTRWVPREADMFRPPQEAAWLRCGETVVGAWVPAGREPPAPGWLERPAAGGRAVEVDTGGRTLEAVWDLVVDGTEQLRRDLQAAIADRCRSPLPEGVHRIGEGPVALGPDVRIEPGTVFDVRHGAVALEAGVEVGAGTRLEGPLWAGAGCRLLGGPLTAVSAGPRCVLRGEIEETTILGWTNKAHAGFLGHAYLGRWVNLGALTTNSDLKNNYGPVRLGSPGGAVDTGLLKLGCLLGDHVKTAIGTMIGTGTAVGAGASLFGGGPCPRWVPPFSWGGAPDGPVWRREAFLETAATVLGRRGVEADAGVRAWLDACWRAGTEARP